VEFRWLLTAFRTRHRLFHFISLIPEWEGLRTDPEEKHGPASGIKRRSGGGYETGLTSNGRIEKHQHYSYLLARWEIVSGLFGGYFKAIALGNSMSA
jgi:hypothetical protein